MKLRRRSDEKFHGVRLVVNYKASRGRGGGTLGITGETRSIFHATVHNYKERVDVLLLLLLARFLFSFAPRPIYVAFLPQALPSLLLFARRSAAPRRFRALLVKMMHVLRAKDK